MVGYNPENVRGRTQKKTPTCACKPKEIQRWVVDNIFSSAYIILLWFLRNFAGLNHPIDHSERENAIMDAMDHGSCQPTQVSFGFHN